MRIVKFSIVALSLALLGACVPTAQPTRYAPVDTMAVDRELSRGRAEVFDAALAVAQAANLNVAVLEKDSGLIRFESASLSPQQLDRYCHYPVVYVESGKPFDTFENWNYRSVVAGVGHVFGSVTLSFLISETADGSNINLRSNWAARNNTESLPCQSKGILERELLDQLAARL